MIYAFDRETTADKVADCHWQLKIAPDWNIGSNPNGGYLLACTLRAMETLVPDSLEPIAATAHYLRPGISGQIADIKANTIRVGRRTATVSGALQQDGKIRLTCTATFGLPGSSSNDSDTKPENGDQSVRSLSISAPALPPPDECTARSELAQAIELPIMNRLEIRVDPKHAEANLHNDAALAGWIRFRDQREPDVLALSLFCDSFPPSIFTRYGPIGWVPTIELSVHARRKPHPGWIKGVFTTSDLAGELFIEDGILWDEKDNLVARSRQLQMILT